MQKKLIALAVASVASGAAFAQTNVTMYGIVDAGYVYSQGDDLSVSRGGIGGTNKFSGIQSGLLSGSRLGFRGEEALGNGLKAVFTLEYALNIDNNSGVGSTGSLNARQQFVGLAGGFGQVALGRQYSPGYQASVNNSPAGGATFESLAFLTRDANNTITSQGAQPRWDNAMTYTTPNWGGFTGKAIYSWGETKDALGTYNDNFVSVSDNGRWGLGANFAAGGFNVDAVYQVRQQVGGAQDITEWFVGGNYDFKFLKIMATYQDQSDKNVTNNDNSTWSVGGVIPFGNSAVHIGYAQTDFDGAWNGNTDSWTLGFTHSMSKRTTLYAGYVWAKNDNDSGMAASPVAGVGARGESNNTVLAGMRHSF